MSKSRNLVDAYYNRDISLHKPGVVPNSSRDISPITSNRHKYELKQRIWPSKTVESWFANHSLDERRAVYSFLDTLYKKDEQEETRRKSPSPRLSRRLNTAVSGYSSRQSSRASKRDLGEVLESLQSFRPAEEKPAEMSSVSHLPGANRSNSQRPLTSIVKTTEIVQPENDANCSRRYLSQTWRVINPRSDAEPNVRPENNSSSFFNYTKKTYPEYFFIHPDWY